MMHPRRAETEASVLAPASNFSAPGSVSAQELPVTSARADVEPFRSDPPRFAVADAMNPGSAPGYQTIVDSALFHIFDGPDSAQYVSSLHAGGLVHVLALSDAGRGFGPQVSEADIREAFGDGWELEALDVTTYLGVVQEAQADAIGLPVGTRVDEPAWLARARRV